MSEINVNKIAPSTGTNVTLGDASDTFKVPSGVTLDIESGATIDATGATVTGFPAGTTTTINNNADNRVITGSGTADTLNGEASLTFDGEVLTLEGNPTTVISQPYNLSIRNNDATATSGNAETGILFRANYSDSVPTDFAGITAGKENTSNGDYGGFISLNTRTNGVNEIPERLRITSSGEIAIGRTSASQSAKVSIESGGNVPAMNVEATSSAQTTKVFKVYCARNTTDGTYDLANFDGPSQTKFKITDSGNAANVNNSYGAISDQRIKQNITDANSQWDDIKAIKVRNFKLKSDTTKTQLGVIAQELEASGMNGLVADASPTEEHVSYSSDFGSIDEEGVFTKGERVKEVKYSVLYMKAIKCLQEAMEKIETLEAKVTALENA
jgi:hypothetical protein